MLDELWKHLAITPELRFLDPACGRGTFLRELRKRLLTNETLIKAFPELTVRDEHIRSKMLYGFEIDLAMVNLLQRQGYVNVQLQDALAYIGDTMKFDVVIGNPPYQSTEDGSKRKKMWVLFAQFAFKNARYIALVTPDGWKIGSKYFAPVKASIIEHWIAEGDANAHFPHVGESIGWWIVDMQTENPMPEPEMPELYKLFARISEKKVGNWHYRDFQTPEELKMLPDSIYSYPIYWTAKQTRYAKPALVKKGWKVIVNNSGGYHDISNPDRYSIVCNDRGVGLGAWGIIVGSRQEGECVLSWVRSKLYRALVATKTGGFNNPFVELPHLGVSKLWTDEELYAHFNLTPEEIACVEANVK